MKTTNQVIMFTTGAGPGVSMPATSAAFGELKTVKAALSRPSGAFLDANLGRQSIAFVSGATISKHVREAGMEKIRLSLNSSFHREKIFTQNGSDAMDLLEGALSKAVDYHVTATTATDDEHKRLTDVLVAELDGMKDKQGFFVLIKHFVSNVSNVTGVPVPAVIAAAKQNPGSASTGVMFSVRISTRTTPAVSESDAMDVDDTGASGIQSDSTSSSTLAPHPNVSFQQPAPVTHDELAPIQNDHQYLGELSYELRQYGLIFLHDQLEKMQRQVSPRYGLLLHKDALVKLTHDIESNVLHSIHSEVLLLSSLPNKDWLDQKYEIGVRAEHAALGDEQRFLARARDEDMVNAEETSVPIKASSIDAPLTEEELSSIQPLNAPPSLNGSPHDKRVHFMRRLFWTMKRKNHEAAAKLKERLLPSEMLPLVKEQELAVLQGISDRMKSLHRPPTPEEIEREYDAQSEHELKDCSKLDSFVSRAKDFHKGIKKFFASAKDKVAGAFCIASASNVALAARHAPPPSPPVQDVKGQFMIALKHAINKMNADVSNARNGGQTILQPVQVEDLALKLEAQMLHHLDQKHIGRPLTRQQQEAFYIQAGHEMLKQIQDVDCFVQTVQAYLATGP